jgi:hypothetical protein
VPRIESRFLGLQPVIWTPKLCCNVSQLSLNVILHIKKKYIKRISSLCSILAVLNVPTRANTEQPPFASEEFRSVRAEITLASCNRQGGDTPWTHGMGEDAVTSSKWGAKLTCKGLFFFSFYSITHLSVTISTQRFNIWQVSLPYLFLEHLPFWFQRCIKRKMPRRYEKLALFKFWMLWKLN